MIHLHCHTGLGNRVAAMANAMSRDGEVVFHWRVTRHCPATAAEVFARPIPGVTFLNDPTPRMFTTFDRNYAHDWDAAGDRRRAAAAYGVILAAMTGTAATNTPSTAVLGRFHRNPGTCPEALVHATAAVLTKYRYRRHVFLLSDLHRATLTAAFQSLDIEVVQPICQPLPDDLLRTRADLLAYISDWKTLLAARRIIACNGPASALHPARAAGLRITYV